MILSAGCAGVVAAAGPFTCGYAAPHKKALVFFINAGKLLADGGRLALFGGHITYNARAGVCFAALRERRRRKIGNKPGKIQIKIQLF